jgi:hypothetical protein
MSRRITALVVAVVAVVFVLGIVSPAQAFPSKTNPCTGCHGVDANVKVTAVQASNNGTTATYNVSVSDTYADGITGWGVFDGATKVAGALGSGSFSVAVGKSYTVYGVAGVGGAGANSIVISPTAPPPPPPSDTTPPTVSITAPASNATVSGSVSITANSSDSGSGVSSVVFKVDGVTVGTDTSAPYAATWNSTGASSGSHTIQAVATDASNNSASASIQVSIASPPPPPTDTTPPTVSITSPGSGATVAGVVAINASASDAGSGVSSVEFRVDGVLLTSDASSPYSANWDTSGVAPGSHTIEVKAIDGAGLSATSSIQVSIASPPPPPPSVEKGTLTVTVTNGSGTPLAGVKVVVVDSATGARHVGVTTALGTADFADLAYGSYTVSTRTRGYRGTSASVVVDAPTESVALSLSSRSTAKKSIATILSRYKYTRALAR